MTGLYNYNFMRMRSWHHTQRDAIYGLVYLSKATKSDKAMRNFVSAEPGSQIR